MVDGVAVSTLSGNFPSGMVYTASLGSNVEIQVGAGSEISLAITLGGIRFLDTSDLNGAVSWLVEFNQN